MAAINNTWSGNTTTVTTMGGWYDPMPYDTWGYWQPVARAVEAVRSAWEISIRIRDRLALARVRSFEWVADPLAPQALVWGCAALSRPLRRMRTRGLSGWRHMGAGRPLRGLGRR